MRRLTALALCLMLMGASAWAELRSTKLTVSSTAASNVLIGAGTLTVVNDGASSIYIRVFWTGETTSDATTSSPEIKSGESFSFTKAGIGSVSILSASSSVVRLYYW